jgi:hypothetical protein
MILRCAQNAETQGASMSLGEGQFAQVLHTEQPRVRLRETVRSLLAQDWTREQLLADLEHYRGLLREAGRDEDEDVVLEVMDFLVGWCSPHMKV